MLLAPRSRLQLAVPMVLALAAAACGGGSNKSGSTPCRGFEAVARCGPPRPGFVSRPLPPQVAANEVQIYVDRSASMAGYLDAAFAGGFGVAPGSSSLRLVIDRVLASGDPTRRRVFSFGTRVRPVPTPSNQDVIRTLVQQDFYRDNDTRLED